MHRRCCTLLPRAHQLATAHRNLATAHRNLPRSPPPRRWNCLPPSAQRVPHRSLNSHRPKHRLHTMPNLSSTRRRCSNKLGASAPRCIGCLPSSPSGRSRRSMVCDARRKRVNGARCSARLTHSKGRRTTWRASVSARRRWRCRRRLRRRSRAPSMRRLFRRSSSASHQRWNLSWRPSTTSCKVPHRMRHRERRRCPQSTRERATSTPLPPPAAVQEVALERQRTS